MLVKNNKETTMKFKSVAAGDLGLESEEEKQAAIAEIESDPEYVRIQAELAALDLRAYDLWALGAGLAQGMMQRQKVCAL